MNTQSAFWSLSADQILQKTRSTTAGLSAQDAKQRLSEYGANTLKQTHKLSALVLLLNQFKSRIIVILIFAAVLSIFLKDALDAIIILAIVLISGLLGFWQERGASNAVEKLLALVQVKATVLRDNKSQEIPNEEVVPGDIVVLCVGKNIPGDCLVLESKDLSVWFLESVISASMVVLVVRTRKSIFDSKPGKYLLMATLATAGVTIVIPWTPLGRRWDFNRCR